MFKDKLNRLIEKDKEEGNNRKKIENLVFFVVVLIITIVVINLIWNDKNASKDIKEVDNNKKLAAVNQVETQIEQVPQEQNLSQKLESILSKIQGVGDVNVFINYSESSEVVAMYNENSKSSTTEETDVSGGVRKVQETDSQKDIIYQENEGVKTPMTKKVVEPKIEGAIITAKGANNIDIKTNIIQAVEAVTGLATHKIQVFEMQ
jgi:stage III sporulation protein AG